MSIFLRGACALLLAGGAAAGASDQSADQSAVAAMFQGVAAEEAAVTQVSCDCGAIDCGDCGDACGDSCGAGLLGGAGVGGGRGQLFVGGEWLNVRAEFSEATAFRNVDVANDLETFEQFDMNYGSSYRVFAGYRLCDCGSEIRFTYTNFDSDGGFESGPNPNLQQDGQTFFGPFEIALGDGDRIVGRADVDIDNYDIGFSKTIPLGSPLCCDPCDPCCGPRCAAWDITWGGGIRVANVDSSLEWNQIRASTNTAPPGLARSTVNFDGVGLRFGVGGRRYFGRSGVVSAYVRGDVSLLLGDVEHRVTSDPAFLDVAISSTEVIPVTDIEAGVTGFLTQNISVTAGYLLSAWHDLGHRSEYIYANSPTQVYSMDDANMLTLDGFFIRAEAAF